MCEQLEKSYSQCSIWEQTQCPQAGKQLNYETVNNKKTQTTEKL